MANRSTAPGRIALMGLVVAGALAGTAGTAGAQYYYYDDGYDPYPAYGYGYRYDYGYAPRPPAAVPRAAPAPVSPATVSRIAARHYGLVRIDRSIRRDDTYIVDGVTAGGQRLRLVLDAYAGELIRRIPLRDQPRSDVVRVDPHQEQAAPRPRLVPQPPERPAELKPPAQASAPATTVPPAPAAPPAPAPEVTAPVEKPPVEASAPATTAPPSPAAPPAPEPAKPTEKPPAEAAAPVAEPPPQPSAIPAPAQAGPETPIAPAVPLD
ncbi:conserved exported hypothetical protein [Hyphomicrobiales bacterium]|nr:conserved exported hypothetical protein [Hyphomicrobiales bacterium]CAH1699281.1 conserved exported hypothetical protein [Hyphomicrobiales bacterium]CAI0343068.1 conserved exported hypothetical protein [Hyphomicrobiales bacterium]